MILSIRSLLPYMASRATSNSRSVTPRDSASCNNSLDPIDCNLAKPSRRLNSFSQGACVEIAVGLADKGKSVSTAGPKISSAILGDGYLYESSPPGRPRCFFPICAATCARHGHNRKPNTTTKHEMCALRWLTHDTNTKRNRNRFPGCFPSTSDIK